MPLRTTPSYHFTSHTTPQFACSTFWSQSQGTKPHPPINPAPLIELGWVIVCLELGQGSPSITATHVNGILRAAQLNGINRNNERQQDVLEVPEGNKWVWQQLSIPDLCYSCPVLAHSIKLLYWLRKYVTLEEAVIGCPALHMNAVTIKDNSISALQIWLLQLNRAVHRNNNHIKDAKDGQTMVCTGIKNWDIF